MNDSFEKNFSEIEFLLKRYACEFRASVQPYRYDLVKQRNPHFKFSPEDVLVRETLMEHVGSLPILAVYFHGHITERVNLGRSLEMLAIHDIGEIVTGDEIVYTKNGVDEKKEAQEALKLLHEKHHDAYNEFKLQKTNEAKFAKSIDKITPDIYALFTDNDVTIVRLKHFANIESKDIVDTIEQFTAPYMQWSELFRGFFAELIVRLREKFETGEGKPF